MNTNTPLQCQVTYIGGPTILLEIGGLRFITDPTLDPAGTAFMLNEKMTESKLSGPAFHPQDPIDVVLLSHDQHFDNLDHGGRDLLKTAGVIITTKPGAKRLQVNCIGLSEGEHHTLDTPSGHSIQITATPARHGPAGIERITGEVIGFHLVITGIEHGEIYITGDTVFYHKLRELSSRIHPKYVFIFAGAARPRGPFNLTMSTNDALDTADAFAEATIIPVHSEGWSHYTENNDNLIEAFRILGIGHRLRLLQPGLATLLFEQ
jgi:L-ascorbate metabolism protein UlaG (beta-lactamase superfamily)